MATAPSEVDAPSRLDRTARRDLAGLVVLTVLLRIPAYLASSHPTFDDGVFGASAVAMRAGGVHFRDVFSSQGPLVLPLEWLGDLVGLRTADSPRVSAVAFGVVLVVVVYLAGRVVSDRAGALLAALLTTTSATILWVSGPISADIPAVAFAALTMLLLLRWRHDLTTSRAVWLGLAISATVSVKALDGPVIVPVALALLAARRLAPILAGGAAAIGSHLLLWLPWGPSKVWEQAYQYHLDAAGSRTPGANLAKTISTLGDRDLPVVVAVAAAAVVVLLGRAALRHRPEGPGLSVDQLLLTWLAAVVAVLLLEHPLWRPHLSLLIAPLALLAARHRPPTRVLAVLGMVVAPYHLVHAWPILDPHGYTPRTEEYVQRLRHLPAGALVISDDPGVVWRAGRRTPPDLVDASILRIETGELTSASVARAAAAPDVCAVLVRSRVRWGSFEDLPARLARAGYAVVLEGPRVERLYVRTECHPA